MKDHRHHGEPDDQGDHPDQDELRLPLWMDEGDDSTDDDQSHDRDRADKMSRGPREGLKPRFRCHDSSGCLGLIAVLIASGISLLLVIVTLLSVPAILVGAAVPFITWMPYLHGVAIGATVLSTFVLQRRSSRSI
jgi:hypothetical protein